MTDQMPPGRENQVPAGPPGQPGYPPYSQYGFGRDDGRPRQGEWSAAPGGVPLRPLALGDILNGSVTLARRNPAATYGLAAIVATIFGVGSTVVQDFYDNRLATDQASLRSRLFLPPQQLDNAAGSFDLTLVSFLLLLVVLALVGHAVLTGMLSGPIGKGAFGRTTSLASAWRDSRIGAVLAATLLLLTIGVGVLVPLVVAMVALVAVNLAPLAVLLGIFGGIGTAVLEILLWVRLSLTMPAVVLERVSPAAAIKRSWQLTRRSFWRLFGILLLTLIIVFVASYVLYLPFFVVGSVVGGGPFGFFGAVVTNSPTMLIIGAIGSILAATVTRPLGAGVNVLLYVDLRMRREGLDLTLRNATQSHVLAGDEFAEVWRPTATAQGMPSAW